MYLKLYSHLRLNNQLSPATQMPDNQGLLPPFIEDVSTDNL